MDPRAGAVGVSALWNYVTDNLGLIGERTLQHIAISGASLGIALVVALPLGLWLGHTGRGALIAVNSSNIGRALPSLALIALFLGVFGLSNTTTIVALAALGIPPILTNAYTGVREVDRDVVEAARGMGMRGSQILRDVELPLAAPVILAGVRTSAVQIVATATLGAVIAGGGLGRFITDGFAVHDTAQILTGAITVALLSIATELSLGGLEHAVTPAGLRVRRGGPAPPRLSAADQVTEVA
ncbi:MAG TPA: ABC transporter permease [Actinomycetes bacterium]|nr:ABC transporter permease [Actinomycetes bacterium]